MVAGIMLHLLLVDLLPLTFLLPTSVLSISQINHLPSDFCLRVCFKDTIH